MKVGEKKTIGKCQWCPGEIVMTKKEGFFNFETKCTNPNCITNVLKREAWFRQKIKGLTKVR